MEAKLRYPFSAVHGTLTSDDNAYVRMYRGKCIIHRKPTKQSERQRAMRAAFGAKYAGRRRGLRAP